MTYYAVVTMLNDQPGEVVSCTLFKTGGAAEAFAKYITDQTDELVEVVDADVKTLAEAKSDFKEYLKSDRDEDVWED